MELKKQLEKINEDLKQLEEKKENFFREYDGRRKRLLARKKEVEQKIIKEHQQKILCAVRESLGEITEENLPAFEKVLKKGREEFYSEMSAAEENVCQENENDTDAVESLDEFYLAGTGRS